MRGPKHYIAEGLYMVAGRMRSAALSLDPNCTKRALYIESSGIKETLDKEITAAILESSANIQDLEIMEFMRSMRDIDNASN